MDKFRRFIKKRYSDILFGILILLLIIPRTRVYFLRIMSFAPGVEATGERRNAGDFHWNLKGLNTADYSFEQARGRVVLVNFWATWCMPCVAEMPSLQALYDDYGDKVDFILVTTDSEEKTLKFLKENGYTLPVYHAINSAPDAFDTRTIPRTFLLDKKGDIVIDAGRADWNTRKVRKLLDDLLAE